MSGLAWFQSPFAEAVGWTLVQSLWQLALIGAVMVGVLAMLRRHSPNVRYIVACGGLLLMVSVPVAGMYLCGSGTHPGGGVMGVPGRNAASVILRDHKRGEFVGRIKSLGR